MPSEERAIVQLCTHDGYRLVGELESTRFTEMEWKKGILGR